MANIEDLIQRARAIRIEKKSKKNTADRIGGLLLDIVRGLGEAQVLKKAQYGGIVATSADVVSDYAAKGYSGPYFYLVGASLSSLVVYQYAGSGSPAQAFDGAAYDFADYSEALRRIDDLEPEIEQIAGGEIGTSLTNKKITGDGVIADVVSAGNRTIQVDVASYAGREITVSGVLYATSSPNNYCWWVFHDANGNVVEKSATSGSTAQRFNNVKITVPNGATTLYVQGSASSVMPTAKVYPYIRETVEEHTEKLARIRDEIMIFDENIVGNPDVSLNRFISSSTGNWSDDMSFVGSIAYRVESGETYIIQANENHAATCHLLTSIDPSTTPSYMTGAERMVIPAGKSATVTVLENGYLLIIREYYTTGSGDYLPTIVSKSKPINVAVTGIKGKVDEISYVQIKHSVVGLKKINGDGNVTASTGTPNRTLSADVSNYVGRTLYISGVLYKTNGADTYCWWVFHDNEGNVVSKSNVSGSENVKYNNIAVVVPEGATTLYVQGSAIEGSVLPVALVLITNAVNELVNGQGVSSVSKTTRTFPLDLASISNFTGRVATNSSYTNDACRHTIDYIKVHKSIIIKNLQNITINVRVYFFDKDLSFLGNTLYVDSENGLTEINVENIPDNAVWFSVGLATDNTSYPNKVKYPRFEVDIESEWGYGVETCKAPYVEYQPFIYSVKSNVPIKITEHSYTTKSVFGYDEGLIHLPPTYSPNGKPTPVIFFIHGDAERYTIGESTFSGHMKMQQCWSDAGFAQVDLDLIPSWLNNTGLASSGGVGSDLDCLCAAWKWIINHYNIDTTGFYLIGRSRGGQAVLEILAKGGATQLPIIAAISMAGANSIMRYSLISYRGRSEAQWQMWCDSRGLPTDGRPSWSSSPVYNTAKPFLTDPDIYNYVSSNFDLWVNKELTGWGLVTKNTDNITPREYFDTFVYPYVQNNNIVTTAIEEFFMRMKNTMEAKSPIPLRLDWCVGDNTQTKEYFVSTPHSYSSVFSEILLNTPGSNVEYRRWPGVDSENPYGETDSHYAENMIFYEGDLVLPNGAVTTNPSKVTMEWMVWCMGKDPRYQGLDYTLPWQ